MLQSWMSDTASLPIGEIAMKAKEAIWRKCECKKCGSTALEQHLPTVHEILGSQPRTESTNYR